MAGQGESDGHGSAAGTDEPVSGVPPRVRALLVCPACRGPLQDHPGALVCVACAVRYPVVEGVPWLVPEHAAPWPGDVAPGQGGR